MLCLFDESQQEPNVDLPAVPLAGLTPSLDSWKECVSKLNLPVAGFPDLLRNDLCTLWRIVPLDIIHSVQLQPVVIIWFILRPFVVFQQSKF